MFHGDTRITPTGVGTAYTVHDAARWEADHPHGRGDGRMFVPSRDPTVRITPTGVGTARRRPTSPPCRTDHPHGRGDGLPIDDPVRIVVGSPPRAWGRRPDRRVRGSRKRITPTGVGTARSSSGRHVSRADHPHGRGDGMPNPPRRPSVHGSPPRAWGRLRRGAGCGAVGRITPTGVGTAGEGRGLTAVDPDHPHGRGDGCSEQAACFNRHGSPPRAWGRPPRELRDHGENRITPTGVGTATRAN